MSPRQNRQVFKVTGQFGPSGFEPIFPGSQGPSLNATLTAAPLSEKLSCFKCGAQTRFALPGTEKDDRIGVELSQGEKDRLENNGDQGISNYDITNCTGRSKHNTEKKELLQQRHLAIQQGSRWQEVAQSKLSQAVLYPLHCDDVNTMEEEARIGKEKANLTEQDTVFLDTQMKASLSVNSTSIRPCTPEILSVAPNKSVTSVTHTKDTEDNSRGSATRMREITESDGLNPSGCTIPQHTEIWHSPPDNNSDLETRRARLSRKVLNSLRDLRFKLPGKSRAARSTVRDKQSGTPQLAKIESSSFWSLREAAEEAGRSEAGSRFGSPLSDAFPQR
jgi:hypothetical protein